MKISDFKNLDKKSRLEMYEVYCTEKWRNYLSDKTHTYLFFEEYLVLYFSNLGASFIKDCLEE